MNVVAFSTPAESDWRWRIVDYGGQTVEESQTTFPTIALAVAAGAERLRRHADRDRPLPSFSWHRQR